MLLPPDMRDWVSADPMVHSVMDLHENSVSEKSACGSEKSASGREFLLNHPPGGKQGVADSDPPCPWRANEERESLPMVPAWATDSEIGAPWEAPPLTHPPAKMGASKEWRTPIRRAHGEPMNRENRFPLSPHGLPIRRSVLLGKRRH